LQAGLGGNVFRKGAVLNPSDGKIHTLTEHKYLEAESVDEKEGELRTVVRLNNSMTHRVKIFDCSLHVISQPLKLWRPEDLFRSC
jgi:hypothetical protein